jgi:hypothetical protein
MVTGPSKHGMERKFKPWRKGKSEKSNKRSSLKQQLRGLQRLLTKLPDTDDERLKELQAKIQALESEIGQKQNVIQEKKNAEDSHGRRFLERQKLSRQEKKVRQKPDYQNADSQAELFKLALDQVYVAHHPNDIKYSQLFNKGERVVDQSRQLYRRAVTRRRILKDLPTTEKVNWIATDQYERLPLEWTIQDEETIFGGSITRKGLKDKSKEKKTDDSRFAVAPSSHDAVLQAAKKIESQIKKEEMKTEDSDSDSDSSSREDGKPDETAEKVKRKVPFVKENESGSSSNESDDAGADEADPLKPSKKVVAVVNAAESSSSDDSDSSGDEEDKKACTTQKKETSKVVQKKSDSSSDDSSSDDSSSDEEEEVKDDGGKKVLPTRSHKLEVKEEVDDFLVDAEEDTNVFENAKEQIPGQGESKGDKSRGWETQKQRPGDFKKKRVRR